MAHYSSLFFHKVLFIGFSRNKTSACLKMKTIESQSLLPFRYYYRVINQQNQLKINSIRRVKQAVKYTKACMDKSLQKSTNYVCQQDLFFSFQKHRVRKTYV